jgi:hypothetical protein
MSNSASSTKQREQLYALVTTRGSKQAHRVALPARIGVTGKNDIIVNAQSLADHAFTLTSSKGGLVLLREPKGEAINLGALKNLGLSAKGPIRGDAVQGGGAGRFVREALGREKAWFDGLPGVARRWLGGFLPQPVRLGVWTSGVAAVLALALAAPEQTYRDLSREPLVLKFDTVRSETVGANPKNLDFVRGYENGVTFEVEVPEANEGHPLLLSFGLAGLNIGKELQLRFNGKQIFESDAEAECAQDFCAKSVRVDGRNVKAGTNVIEFKHKAKESSYFIAKMHVRPLPPLTELEIQQLAHWLGLAQRAYDERGIVPENLVSAKNYVSKLTKLASERDSASEAAAKAKILEGEIDKAFAQTVDEYWTAYKFAEKLGNKLDMEQALHQLLKLHPNPKSEEHADIIEKLQALKEQKP